MGKARTPTEDAVDDLLIVWCCFEVEGPSFENDTNELVGPDVLTFFDDKDNVLCLLTADDDDDDDDDPL